MQLPLKKLIWFFLFLLVVAAGCSNGEQPEQENAPAQDSASSIQTISPQEAAALIENRPDLLILDVRTPQELRNGFIERSILTPFWSLVRGTVNLPKDRPLLLVCAVGGRSYAAGQMLIRSGYREVYNLRGGIVAWTHAGLPLRTP